MKKLTCFASIPVLSVLFLLLSGIKPLKTDNNFRTIQFDTDWRFHKGDLSGAESQAFDDSEWRKIDVPHD